MAEPTRHAQLLHQETLCLEVLLSALDARESAKAAGTPMLIYLADLLAERARQELETIRVAIDRCEERASEDDATR